MIWDEMTLYLPFIIYKELVIGLCEFDILANPCSLNIQVTHLTLINRDFLLSFPDYKCSSLKVRHCKDRKPQVHPKAYLDWKRKGNVHQ